VPKRLHEEEGEIKIRVALLRTGFLPVRAACWLGPGSCTLFWAVLVFLFADLTLLLTTLPVAIQGLHGAGMHAERQGGMECIS
jgi:hypothetical protein